MPATTEDPAGDFGSLAAWVYDQVGLHLTLARGLSSERMLEGFGLQVGRVVEETLREADESAQVGGRGLLGRPRARVGERGGWGYAVEHFTGRGSDEQTLRRLSAMGGEALALEYNLKISTFWYAAGELVCGFDMTVPHVRLGPEPRRFDREMERAGSLRPGVPEPAAMGARFVQLAFGITIDREMLERPLLSVELP